MSKNNGVKKTNPKKVQRGHQKLDPEKNIVLIFGGLILAMISIGLLIFVLSEKVFHLS